MVASFLLALVFSPFQSPPQAAPELPASPVSHANVIYDIRDLALPAELRRVTVDPADPTADHPNGELAAREWLRKKRLALLDTPAEGVAADTTAWSLVETLVRCLAAKVDPGASVSAKEGMLVVKGDAKMQLQVEAALESLRAASDVIPIEIRILELDEDARKLVAKLEKAGSAASLSTVTTLGSKTIESLIASDGCTMLGVPRLSLLQLDHAEVTTGDHASYVASYDLVAIEGAGTIADPVVKTIEVGSKIEVRAAVAAGINPKDAPTFALRVEFTHSDFKRPIAQVKTDVGMIQLPEVKTATLGSTIAGTVGSPILVGGSPRPRFGDEDDDVRLYLRVTVGAPQRLIAVPPTEKR